ncbi:unnamed protein product [Brassica rapa subsp. narinosa]
MFLFQEGEVPTALPPPALSPGGGRFLRSASCVAGFSWSQLVGSVLDPVGALSVFLGSWFQVVHGFVLSDELSIGSMKLSEGKTKRGREELLEVCGGAAPATFRDGDGQVEAEETR